MKSMGRYHAIRGESEINIPIVSTSVPSTTLQLPYSAVKYMQSYTTLHDTQKCDLRFTCTDKKVIILIH